MNEEKMKLIIAGSRSFTDRNLLFRLCDHMLQYQAVIEIVSGTARGADQLGEEYAKIRGFSIKRFPANWEKNGKFAGKIRNLQMGQYADALIAFWDGKSKGTKHMIEVANYYNLNVKIHIDRR